ncbi:mechanosensitive ion channel family protein [Pedobacter sp. L105]|uniref:mechanosensitive ion channel family protein n=1 Tax=Pedobacter sp. L105 TaxID=1641871 RepID=UPI00131E9A62|nr:mechanosensitive ion channel family protein [Pedobacter sp. L105]
MKTTTVEASADHTLQFYDKAFDWVIAKGPNIIIGIIILLIGMWLIRLFAKWLTTGLHQKSIDPSLKPFFISLSVNGLRLLLIFTVMQFIGIQMTIFVTLVGAFGVAAGLALSGTLQNFASGILILILKPFVVGDNIVAQGQEGTVTIIEIFYTTITTFDNRLVVVPNGKLSNEIIINVSTKGSRRLDITMKFNYGIEYDQLLEIINKTIEDSKDILKTPEHRVGVTLLEEGGYTVLINVWLNSHGFNDARLKFQENLMRDMKEAGLPLPGMSAKES